MTADANDERRKHFIERALADLARLTARAGPAG
jgi:hypothetical protein